jgi:hypothetical protein
MPGVVLSADDTTKEESDKPALSETTSASCLVKITCDPAIFPLSQESVLALLHSPGVGYAAYHDVLGDETGFDAELCIGFKVISVQDSGKVTRSGSSTQPADGRDDDSGPLGGMMGGMGMMGGGMMGGYGSYGGMGMMARGMRGGYGGGGYGPAPTAPPPDTIFGQVSVSYIDGGAVEFLRKLCEFANEGLQSTYQAARSELGMQYGLVLDRAEDADRAIRQLQEKWREKCAQADEEDLSRENLLNRSRRFRNEKLEIEMTLAGQQARREALEEEIASINAETELRINDLKIEEMERRRDTLQARFDSLLKKLREHFGEEEMEKILKKPVVRATRKSAADPDAMSQELKEVNDLRMELSHARQHVDNLNEQASSIRQAVSSDQLRDLNEQLVAVSVDATEMYGRLRFVQELLTRIKDLMKHADDYEREVVLELPLLKDEYRAFHPRARELLQRINNEGPRPNLIVIDRPE